MLILFQNCPPPLPHRRGYTIYQNKKTTFPQLRKLKLPFKDSNQATIPAGEEVLVTGISPRPAHFLVQKDDNKLHIPNQYLIMPIIC